MTVYQESEGSLSALLTTMDLSEEKLSMLSRVGATRFVKQQGIDTSRVQALMVRSRLLRLSLMPVSSPVLAFTPALWFRGVPTNHRRVSIVGSRKPSGASMTLARSLARTLVEMDISVVSGLALGTDIEVHRAALAVGGRCLAVLPCGMSRVMPPEHSGDARIIVDRGGLVVSGFGPDLPAARARYLRRNQTIAYLSQLMIIAHADSLASGSGAAARRALKIGTPLAAIPGSEGADALIADGAAAITCEKDLVSLLSVAHI